MQMALSNILGSARDTASSIVGQPEGSEGGSFDTLEGEDFDVFNETELEPNQWSTFAEYHVEPQTAYNVGFGKADLPENQGTFYATFDDGSGNTVTGQVRVKTNNSNETNPDTELSGVSTSKLDTDENDSRVQYKLGERTDTPKVGEDSKIVLQFRLKGSSSGTSISRSASRIMMDCTRYE